MRSSGNREILRGDSLPFSKISIGRHLFSSIETKVYLAGKMVSGILILVFASKKMFSPFEKMFSASE